MALKDEVAAVLDLGDGIEAAQVHLFALAGGELGAQDQGPVVQPLANHLWAEPIGGGLQGLGIVDRQESVIVFAKADVVAVQFLLDKGVAVEVVGGLEGEEGGHADHHRSQDFVPDVEIVMGEAAALAS